MSNTSIIKFQLIPNIHIMYLQHTIRKEDSELLDYFVIGPILLRRVTETKQIESAVIPLRKLERIAVLG